MLFVVSVAYAFQGDFTFESDNVRYLIDYNGISKSLVDKKTGRELLGSGNYPFSYVKKRGRTFSVSYLKIKNGKFEAEFGESGVHADFRIISRPNCIIIELSGYRGEGIEEIALLQLKPSALVNTGSVITARWDKNNIVSMMGLSERVHTRFKNNDLLVASVYPEFGMEGQKVAMLAVPTSEYMRTVQKVEKDFHLPSPKLTGEWAKLSSDVRKSYLFADLTEANADEIIRYAKLADFKYIMIYSGIWSASLGTYPINTKNFPEGENSLKRVIDKCHAAGIKVGMHMLTSFVSKDDPLVRPVPDKRLLKDASGILATNLDANSTEIMASAQLKDFPTEMAFYGHAKAGQDIQINDEIIHYSKIGGVNKNSFIRCIRGYAGTRAVPHEAGSVIYHIAERFGSYLADLRTSLMNEISERIALIINHCGFDMIFFDGVELNSANGVGWFWTGRQVTDTWKRVNRDLLVEGSGITSWLWHILSRGMSDDYAAIAPKEYLEYHKIPDRLKFYQANFIPTELGWWGFFEHSLQYPATTPDEAEYYAVRMLAYNTPVSIETSLKTLKSNGRSEEMLAMLGKFERFRLQNIVPETVRKSLQTGEWHVIWNREKPEIRPVKYDSKSLNPDDKILVKNEFNSQVFKFRLQAVPQLAKVGDHANIVLLSPDRPISLNPVFQHMESGSEPYLSHSNQSKKQDPEMPASSLPGFLIARIEYSNPAARRLSGFSEPPEIEVQDKEKPLDLSTHRALAVKLKVKGLRINQGAACAVMNIQLEAAGKTYRDHYIDIDFIGERTIIIPAPNTERMLAEFRPARGNYFFKMAMYSNFDYKKITALNFRWMRQPSSMETQCEVISVEAIKEKEMELIDPSIFIGTSEVDIPVTLKTGDYVEYWGGREAQVYNSNGVQLSTVKMKDRHNIKKGYNLIYLGRKNQSPIQLTTILIGEALSY